MVLDCSKAFDLARFDLLFARLLDRVPAIVVRALSFCYKEQLAWVRWGKNNVSETFRISNGTRQGSAGSPNFWGIYLNPLFAILRESGVGCHIGGVFVGVVVYADDILLLAPNRRAAQMLLSLCESFASENNIMFSTHPVPAQSKSKALHVVGQKSHTTPPPPLVLCGKELPWVKRCEHLGHIFTSDGTLEQDCREKRAAFIDSAVKCREMFGFAHPEEIITAVEKHSTALYGSNLWRLDSPVAESVYSSWRTNIKLAWGLPRGCHTYFIDNVLATHVPPVKASVLGKFHSFFHGLLRSESREVQVVSRLAARDLRSSLGSNLRILSDVSGLDPWSTTGEEMKVRLRESLRKKTPESEIWRVTYLRKLLSEKQFAFYNCDQAKVIELSQLIDSLVVN